MVVRHRRPFWTILISLTTVAFVYLTLINITIDQDLPKAKNFGGNVKNIVAYSLLKKIEIESEQYTCDEELTTGKINYSAINGSVEVDNNDTVVEWNDDGNAWTNIDGSGLHVLSVHMDRRLDPYHYVRIIGMIRGNYDGISAVIS